MNKGVVNKKEHSMTDNRQGLLRVRGGPPVCGLALGLLALVSMLVGLPLHAGERADGLLRQLALDRGISCSS